MADQPLQGSERDVCHCGADWCTEDAEKVPRSVADELADAVERYVRRVGKGSRTQWARNALAAYRVGGNTNEETG